MEIEPKTLLASPWTSAQKKLWTDFLDSGPKLKGTFFEPEAVLQFLIDRFKEKSKLRPTLRPQNIQVVNKLPLRVKF